MAKTVKKMIDTDEGNCTLRIIFALIATKRSSGLRGSDIAVSGCDSDGDNR